MCEDSIITQLSFDTACNTLMLADLHSSDKIKTKAVKVSEKYSFE
jgi:hypothetical protein